VRSLDDVLALIESRVMRIRAVILCVMVGAIVAHTVTAQRKDGARSEAADWPTYNRDLELFQQVTPIVVMCTPTTRAQARRCGISTPFRGPAKSATTHGVTTAGRIAPATTSGRSR
jgi:hypothetical protein